MPVLYGVFLYMGVSSLKGIQVCFLFFVFLIYFQICPLGVEALKHIFAVGQSKAGFGGNVKVLGNQ